MYFLDSNNCNFLGNAHGSNEEVVTVSEIPCNLNDGKQSSFHQELKSLDPVTTPLGPISLSQETKTTTSEILVSFEKEKRSKREKCRWILPLKVPSQNTETLLSAGIKFDNSLITPPATPTTPTPKVHPAVAKKDKEKRHPDPLRKIGTQNLPKFKRNRGTLLKKLFGYTLKLVS